MSKLALGVTLYAQWIEPRMVPGETHASLCQHLANQGVQVVTIRWGGSDHSSYWPQGEPRPGEFWWGNTPVTRDANGDITSTLYSSSQAAPEDAPVRVLLDACATYGLKVVFQLARWTALKTAEWPYHVYKQGRLTPAGNASQAGVAGWLTTKKAFFSDATARSYFKNRIDAFINSFGDHSAIWCVDLGNEFTHLYTWDDDSWETNTFFPWVDEMSDYLWDELPGDDADKPFLTISEYRGHKPNDNINNVYSHFTSVPDDKVMVTWHSYETAKTLIQIRDAIYAAQDRYPGATLRIGEDWPWQAGPRAVPDETQDINIPDEAYNDGFSPDSNSPYEHERMYGFLMAAIPRAADYSRWCSYVDGSSNCWNTIKRCAEILKPVKDMTESITLTANATRHTDNISSDGVLDFKLAAMESAEYLSFVLVGSGEQTIDFGVAGDWRLTTYDWTADNGARVEDEVLVNPGAVTIDFGDYTDGFCPGFLDCVSVMTQVIPVVTALSTLVVIV